MFKKKKMFEKYATLQLLKSTFRKKQVQINNYTTIRTSGVTNAVYLDTNNMMLPQRNSII